ncbi:LAFE_0G12574g1_1 [Lachancea fermentati]|uniref:ATP-dependent RNA helicase SUV3, mitochondrial n=1 Tax=Lachancea fermentati TaxID=4955 RepID=A0A1G4MI60_LACFM|nr:LAFE_0G12574g1_1 [Lachancea fermentati]
MIWKVSEVCIKRLFPSRGHFQKHWNSFYSTKASKSIEWPLGKPNFNHLPPEERKDINCLDFSFPSKTDNVYTRNPTFKDSFSKAIRNVFNSKVIGFTIEETESKTMAWLKLRESIYQQLRDKDLDMKISKYQLSLSELIHPSYPSSLLLQLHASDQVSDTQWKAILKKSEITTIDKYIYVIGNVFDFIYRQQILPVVTPVKSSANKEEDVDISNPAEWFPEARKWRREIIMHVGPTNSGKTYRALQRLKHCNRGYYAGPLRLLAREIYERFKNEGIRCNLLTGEEIIDELDEMGNPAGLTSGTVEMVPLSQKFDVVVLDEIQMMGDSDRGWAWTNALLGVQAREVHLCGEKSTLPLIKKIVKMTGDKLVINEYERLGTLIVEDAPIKNGLKGLRKGDCVVAFSKKKILDMKLRIEKQTNLKVAVVYGSLPPETRIQQATMFNNGDCDVLVASDAVGMGLNLSIERVIFTTHMKFNGQEMVNLTSSNVKQIGGRAGRFRVASSVVKDMRNEKRASIGYITAINSEVLSAVRDGINAPVEYLNSAVVWPTDEICGKLMTHYPARTKVSTLLQTFATKVEQRSAKLFTLSDLKNRLNNIGMFEHLHEIPFFEKLRLSNAPVKDLPLVKKAYVEFCHTIARRETRSLLSYPFSFNILDLKCIKNEKITLEYYESLHNIIMLFFWLSNRYSNYFIDQESAYELKNICEMIIFEKLDRLKRNPYANRGPPTANALSHFTPRRQKQH